MSGPTRLDVVTEARRWLGTPWQHQQRQRGLAVDCAGLVIGVARALGLVPPTFDVTGYGRQPNGSLLAVCGTYLTPIQPQAIQPGDVLVLTLSEDPQHLGIVGDYRHGGLSLIHAASKQGQVIEHRLIFAPNLRLAQAYQFTDIQR